MNSMIDKLSNIFYKGVELFVFWIVSDVLLLIVFSAIDNLIAMDSSLTSVLNALKVTVGTFGLDMFSFIIAIIVLVLIEFQIIKK